MSWPKIIYDPGTGAVTLNFLRPPRNVPGHYRAAVRHDNVATSGVRETVLERVDDFLALEMPFVAADADLEAWRGFMSHALAGGLFAYYPDAAQTAFTNYWLEDTDWQAAYRSAGYFSFTLKFRQVVT